MATWNGSTIVPINIGSSANDGTGDAIRDAFSKVDNSFNSLSSFLAEVNGPLDFSNANVKYALNANVANVTTLILGTVTGQNNFVSNINLSANIVPTGSGSYDLGSPTNRFRTIYTQSTNAATQIQTSSDTGILKIHANAFIGDQQDTGILGNITSDYNGANTYAFFGHQYTTNNFVYKITNTDATLGNNIVYDGIYGNVQFGSAFLSNVTNSTASTNGALVVKGGVGVGGNMYIDGTIIANGYPVLTTNSVGVGAIYNGSGSVFTGNTLFISTTPSTSSVTGAVIVLGGVGVGGNVTAGNVTATLYGSYYGTVQTAVQPNITSLGTLTGLTVSGPIYGNLQATAIGVTGITAGTITTTGLTVGAAGIATSANATISINNVTTNTVTSTGQITAGNIVTTKGLYWANGIPFMSSTYSNANVTAYIPVDATITALQANIGAYETWANIQLTGGSTQGLSANLGAYQTYANTNVQSTSANLGAYQTYANANAATQTTTSNSLRANITAANVNIATLQTQVYANANVAAYLPIYAGNINSGNIVATGNITVSNSIIPSANLTVNIGSPTAWFNNFYGTAVHAQYADLAEIYTSDAEYEPGTVVVFGGDAEITITTQFADVGVAGVISTNPAYLMNGSESGLPVALRGRVPVKVIGPVAKGDLLVTAEQNPGYATSIGKSKDEAQAVFAKAIETNTESGAKVITAVIL